MVAIIFSSTEFLHSFQQGCFNNFYKHETNYNAINIRLHNLVNKIENIKLSN